MTDLPDLEVLRERYDTGRNLCGYHETGVRPCGRVAVAELLHEDGTQVASCTHHLFAAVAAVLSTAADDPTAVIELTPEGELIGTAHAGTLAWWHPPAAV